MKAINDTMGPDGLVPSLLVYGHLPRFTGHEGHPTQAKRWSTVAVALAAASQAVGEARINMELRSKVPPAAGLVVGSGGNVRIFRETSRRWDGPFTVTRIVRKSVWVTDGQNFKAFSMAVVLPIQTRERNEDYQDLIPTVVRDENSTTSEIHLVDEFTAYDPRAKLAACVAAVQEELNGLLYRDVSRLVDRKYLAPNANLLGGRIISCITNVGASWP